MVLERRAFAPHVGQPDRHPAGSPEPGLELLAFGPGRGVPRSRCAGPVDEEGAGVARTADEEALRRGVRVADEAGRRSATRRRPPSTISVAPKITRTSPGWVAPDTIWSHKASMVPPVITASLPGQRPGGLAHRAPPAASASPRRPWRPSSSAFQRPCGVEQPERGRDAGVDGRQCPKWHWSPRPGRASSPGHRAPRVEAQRRKPSASGMVPGGRRRRGGVGSLRPALAVPVEEAGQHRAHPVGSRR